MVFQCLLRVGPQSPGPSGLSPRGPRCWGHCRSPGEREGTPKGRAQGSAGLCLCPAVVSLGEPWASVSPPAKGFVFWLRLSGSIPVALVVPVPSSSREHCPHEMLGPPARGQGRWGVCGGPMVPVMSPAPRTSGPCSQEPAAALTRETTPGSSVPAHAEPNHHPRPCFGAVPPRQPPGMLEEPPTSLRGLRRAGARPPSCPPPRKTHRGGRGHVGTCDAGICPPGWGRAGPRRGLCHQWEPEVPPAPSWGAGCSVLALQ